MRKTLFILLFIQFVSCSKGQKLFFEDHSFILTDGGITKLHQSNDTLYSLKCYTNKQCQPKPESHSKILSFEKKQDYIILKQEGYNIELIDNYLKVEDNCYDYIVETMFDEQMLKLIIKALKKEGLLVVKSRKKQPTEIIASDLVSKELTLSCVNYYSFKESMNWLEKNYKLIEHLLGNSYYIDDWKIAFEIANSAESKKIFINF